MRVHSVSKANTHKQQNPYIEQYAGYNAAGKTASGFSFEEYLKSYFQQSGAVIKARQTEGRADDVFVVSCPSLTGWSEYEPKRIDIAL